MDIYPECSQRMNHRSALVVFSVCQFSVVRGSLRELSFQTVKQKGFNCCSQYVLYLSAVQPFPKHVTENKDVKMMVYCTVVSFKTLTMEKNVVHSRKL